MKTRDIVEQVNPPQKKMLLQGLLLPRYAKTAKAERV
jgi:hypothetical protein